MFLDIQSIQSGVISYRSIESFTNDINLFVISAQVRSGKYFYWFGPQLRINYKKQDIILNHYPLLTYAGCYTNTWNLFGHVHTLKIPNGNPDTTRMNYLLPLQYDVGVDNNNYTPISFDEVYEIINKQLC